MSIYTRWYRVGTAGVTAGGNKVTGSGTYWKSAGINPGDLIQFGNGNPFFEIVSVDSDTSLTLAGNYTGSTVSNAAYAIVRNFTSSSSAKVASQAAGILNDFQKYIDTDMDRITGKSAYEVAVANGYTGTISEWLASLNGKSAYEIATANGYTGTPTQWLESLKGKSAYQLAVANGFTGTEAQWVESLKGAEEIVKLNEKVEPITYNNAPAHNAIFRGKNLGTTVTAAQIQAIRNKTYEDIYCGDVWKLTLPTFGATDAYVWGCDIHGGLILGLHNHNWVYPFIAEDDLAADETFATRCKSGHLYGSTLYNRYLPAILTELESVIDPAYIITRNDFVGDAAREDSSYPSSYGARLIRSHSISHAERIYIASARNIAFDSATVHQYTWIEGHIEQIQQNTGWLIINSLIFPYFIHRPFVRSQYRDNFVNLSAFQTINNYQQVSVGSNFSGLVLPFVILG